MLPTPVAISPQPKQYNTHDTVIINSGDRNIYFDKEALIQQFNASALKVHVGTATGQVQ